MEFDAAAGLAALGELAGVSAAAAGIEEICDRALGIVTTQLAPSAALILYCGRPGVPLVRVAGDSAVGDELHRAAESVLEPRGGAQIGLPVRLALPLVAHGATLGALALERPSSWSPGASAFLASAVQVLAGALDAARALESHRAQEILLARRNVELEALRELADRLHDLTSEETMLQAALELVLEKLDLQAGWIFWGETRKGRLELAAHHGITQEFVAQARSNGVGTCLCVDVFATGRLQVARNTIDCPRLPGLVCAAESASHACVPLKFERGILGVLNIANRADHLFTPQDLQFLETVGHHICLAVDKARSARAESARNAEARALATLARGIGGSLDQEHVLKAVGRYGCELLATQRCVILLGDDPANLRFAHLTGPGLDGLEVGGTADLNAFRSRALIAALCERRTLVLDNAFEDPRANAELNRRWTMGSAIVAPLVAHDRLQGLMVVARPRPSSWTAEELALAGALASQAAVALENALLYREAQDSFRKLQEAQYGISRAERLATLGTLASSLAHEIRNPLNSISLQLVLLSRRFARLAEESRDELMPIVETARHEIARLNGLVEEFLSLSSIDRIVQRAADPEGPVREALALMAPMAHERGIVLLENLAGSIPPIALDAEKLKQVLINLIRNAIEAMPDGGSLTVSTGLHDGSVLIRIADSGTGIDPGLDVFDFFTTTKSGGTGLGLPIARRIVEGHGGSLTYQSAPGRGTVFSIALPRN